MDAEIDHLHAGIPQRSSDDLNPAVVTVETDLGDQNAELPNWLLSIVRRARTSSVHASVVRGTLE